MRILKLMMVLGAMLLYGCSERESHKSLPITTIEDISIIPQPKSIRRLPGQFLLSAETRIIATDYAGIRLAARLNEVLTAYYGLKLEISGIGDVSNSIRFATLNDDEVLSPEGYALWIDSESIRITGSERGMFYAVQSLLRLLPQEFYGIAAIPAVEVSDAPRFPYRGMHLDVSRHFMPVEFIKKYIRLLSQYKFNYFHWHLTDDQGWRIEIKKYPKLTEIGSKRPETVLRKNFQPYVGDRVPVEGFYSQDEIREIVEYAKNRYVTIIPEIDIPGHSSAALAAYPQFGCKQNYPYGVKTTWGAFPDVYCPTEETFQFLRDIIGEVIDLFPESPYIHVGGDEVVPDHWRTSPYIKNLQKMKKLKNVNDIHSLFLERIGEYVSSRGKSIIGWDEILDGRVPPNATVMSWRGLESGTRAAKSRYPTIMASDSFVYFDHPQSGSTKEPLALGQPITLEKVYKYEPVPQDLSDEYARYIIGAQGCVWTEFLKNPRDVEYMVFPRALALAEVLWSSVMVRDFEGFSRRLKSELFNLDRENVNYRIPERAEFNQKFTHNKKAVVDLKSSAPSK